MTSSRKAAVCTILVYKCIQKKHLAGDAFSVIPLLPAQ